MPNSLDTLRVGLGAPDAKPRKTLPLVASFVCGHNLHEEAPERFLLVDPDGMILSGFAGTLEDTISLLADFELIET